LTVNGLPLEAGSRELFFVTSYVQAGNDHPHGHDRKKDRAHKDVEGTEKRGANEYVGLEDIEGSLDDR